MLAARLALAYVIVEISKISLRKSATRSEQSLLSRYRQPHARGRDREQIAEPAKPPKRCLSTTAENRATCRRQSGPVQGGVF